MKHLQWRLHLTKGEVNQEKAKVTPNGIPPLHKPINKGMKNGTEGGNGLPKIESKKVF